MTLPGFNAETSLHRTGVRNCLTTPFVEAGGVMPQQLPHLFCRVTDCPCQYRACREAGGTVVPGSQPPCHYRCEMNWRRGGW